jgi:hypothetical protein
MGNSCSGKSPIKSETEMSTKPPEHAIRAWREIRAELAGEIIQHRREIERISQLMSHLDALLRAFAPDSSPEHIPAKIRRSTHQSQYLVYGEMRRRCLEAMRESGSITADIVIERLMREKSLDPGDQRLRSDLLKRALRALDALRRDNRVEKVGWGLGVQWKLKADEIDRAMAEER